MMAVASARADIASTSYVNTQVQSVNTALTTHTGNSNIHVTAADKAAWSAKQDANLVTSSDTMLDDDQKVGWETHYPSVAAVDVMITHANDLLGGDLSDATTDISALQGDVSSLDSRLDTAEGTISQHTNQLSTLNSEKQAKSDSTVSGTKGTDFHYLTAGTGVGANLVALDTQVKTNADAIATKAAASDLTALTTRVGTAEGAINTLNGSGAGSVANSIATALTAYSTTAQMNTALADKADKATTYTKTEADAAFDAKNAASTVESTLNAKIGTVPSGKTVVGMISEAQTAATYDDTALKARVKTIEDSDAYNSGITSTLVGKISSNETAIGTINNSNVMKSGIDSTKVAQIATNASNISGLQTSKQDKITSTAMLDADLVDDSTSTNKFVTSGEKSTWSGKQDAINDLADIRSGAAAGATALQQSDVAQTYSANGTAPVSGAAVASAISGAAGNYDAAGAAASAVAALDKTAAAVKGSQTGNVVTGVSEENGLISATFGNAITSVTKSGEGNILSDISTSDNAVTVTVSGTAIPKPSGTCTDCVLHFNGTAYAWEEVGR